jgi:hypothetical protein
MRRLKAERLLGPGLVYANRQPELGNEDLSSRFTPSPLSEPARTLGNVLA